MAYEDNYAFAKNWENFQNRVHASCSKSAVNITSEADTTDNYEARQQWVGAVHKMRTKDMFPYALAVANGLEATINTATETPQTTEWYTEVDGLISDVAIDGQIGGLINSFSR